VRLSTRPNTISVGSVRCPHSLGQRQFVRLRAAARALHHWHALASRRSSGLGGRGRVRESAVEVASAAASCKPRRDGVGGGGSQVERGELRPEYALPLLEEPVVGDSDCDERCLRPGVRRGVRNCKVPRARQQQRLGHAHDVDCCVVRGVVDAKSAVEGVIPSPVIGVAGEYASNAHRRFVRCNAVRRAPAFRQVRTV